MQTMFIAKFAAHEIIKSDMTARTQAEFEKALTSGCGTIQRREVHRQIVNEIWALTDAC